MLSSILTDTAHRKPDYEQARHWALRAAESGVAASMTRLGSMYNEALGVERDAKEAVKWWRKAAQLGDADGQALLGAALYLGTGVQRDPVAALAWLIRAKDAHSKMADKFYAAVSSACTPEEHADAAARALLPLGEDEAAP